MRTTHTFLYIHDDRNSKVLLRDLLKKYSTIELLTAKGAEEGIELARKEVPVVIFIDTHLPKMNGYSTAKILRKDQAFLKTRLIALCDDRENDTMEKCLNFGFNESIEKPITHQHINHIIDKLK